MNGRNNYSMSNINNMAETPLYANPNTYGMNGNGMALYPNPMVTQQQLAQEEAYLQATQKQILGSQKLQQGNSGFMQRSLVPGTPFAFLQEKMTESEGMQEKFCSCPCMFGK